MDNLISVVPTVPDIKIPDAVKETYDKYQTLVLTSVITATIVLVSMAWNDVIQSIMNKYYPSTGTKTIVSKIYYAIVITLFVILLQIYIFPYLQTNNSTKKNC